MTPPRIIPLPDGGYRIDFTVAMESRDALIYRSRHYRSQGLHALADADEIMADAIATALKESPEPAEKPVDVHDQRQRLMRAEHMEHMNDD